MPPERTPRSVAAACGIRRRVCVPTRSSGHPPGPRRGDQPRGLQDLEMEGAIVPRKLAALVAALIFTFGLMGQAAPALAKSPMAQGGSGAGMGAQKPMTNAQRKAAAVRAAKARNKAGGAAAAAIPGTNTKMLAGQTSRRHRRRPDRQPDATRASALPDYFGNIPNYANSPLPTSVSIQGDGTDAFATATVNRGRDHRRITMVNAGIRLHVRATSSSSAAAAAARLARPRSIAERVRSPAITAGTGGVRLRHDARHPQVRRRAAASSGRQRRERPRPVPAGRGAGHDHVRRRPLASAPAADYYEIAVVQYRSRCTRTCRRRRCAATSRSRRRRRRAERQQARRR